MRKLCLTISLLFSLFCLSAQTNQDSIIVSAQLDTNQILIGQQTQLTLSASYPSGDTLSFPNIKDSISGKIVIVSEQKPDTSYENNLAVTIISKAYTITSFDSGYYAIKPFKFAHNKDSVKTEPLLLTVNTIPVDTANPIKDINDIIPVSYTLLNQLIDWLKDNYIWLGIAIILLVLLIYALLYYLKQRKKKNLQQPEKPKIIIPPHIEAIKRLKTTEDKKLWQSDQTKTYYSEITETLRNYLEGRFNINAMEKTTDEIMQGLRLKPIEQKDKNELYELFRLADLVKFAKEKPVADENESAIKDARDFVNNTKQEPEENKPQNPKIEDHDGSVE